MIPNRTQEVPEFDYEAELKEIQKDLDEVLPPDAILVGHSLQHDLKLLEVSVYIL